MEAPASKYGTSTTYPQAGVIQQSRKITIERIACANSGDHPLKLSALLLPSCLKFHTEPAVLAPGQEGDLVITLDKTKLPSFHTEEKHLTLIIDGVIGKPSEKTIEVIIKN